MGSGDYTNDAWDHDMPQGAERMPPQRTGSNSAFRGLHQAQAQAQAEALASAVSGDPFTGDDGCSTDAKATGNGGAGGGGGGDSTVTIRRAPSARPSAKGVASPAGPPAAVATGRASTGVLMTPEVFFCLYLLSGKK